MENWVLTVSDLNEYVRKTLAADPMLRGIRLKGEISNFKRHASGHWYFTLKDETSRISCVMFRQNAMSVSMQPRDGLAVIVSGSASLWAQGGSYQFYCDAMRPDGVGALFARFEALKQQLSREGLFDVSRKRPLPLRPRRIAVVTSPTGAVLHDIRTVTARRDPTIPLVLLPVQVQGVGAAEDVAQAIRTAGTLPGVDVIITGRGGGSMEDLWAFNEEIVVRAIAQSPVPVISAVGHETDVTLADFAADQRAATPSVAAELAVQDREEVLGELDALRRQMSSMMEARLMDAALCAQALRRRLQQFHPAEQLTAREKRLTLAHTALKTAMTARLTQEEKCLLALRTKLTAISPTQVLDRGFALALDGGRPVTTAAAAAQLDKLRLMFRDGGVDVRVMKEDAHGGKEEADL